MGKVGKNTEFQETNQFLCARKMKRMLAFGLLLVGICHASELRDPRWFNKQTRTVFKTFKTSKLVVETTPSSCVVVESNLPPCRHLRSFWPFVSSTSRIMQTKASNMQKTFEDHNWKPVAAGSNKPTPPLSVRASSEPIHANPPAGWDWDFFNLGPKEVTVTQTIEHIHTTKVYDPNTVVTFSVKGCRPSRLPFDLTECREPEPVTQSIPEGNVVVMAPLQFVHSVDIATTSSQNETATKLIAGKELKNDFESHPEFNRTSS